MLVGSLQKFADLFTPDPFAFCALCHITLFCEAVREARVRLLILLADRLGDDRTSEMTMLPFLAFVSRWPRTPAAAALARADSSPPVPSFSNAIHSLLSRCWPNLRSIASSGLPFTLVSLGWAGCFFPTTQTAMFTPTRASRSSRLGSFVANSSRRRERQSTSETSSSVVAAAAKVAAPPRGLAGKEEEQQQQQQPTQRSSNSRRRTAAAAGTNDGPVRRWARRHRTPGHDEPDCRVVGGGRGGTTTAARALMMRSSTTRARYCCVFPLHY